MSPTRHPCVRLVLCLSLAWASLASQAQTSTKDIVLDRVAAHATQAAAPARASSDALAVSVLLEGADGVLLPRPVTGDFATGDRFRLRLLAGRQGHVALYNTNAQGVFNPQPVWRGEVVPGMETITPRLRLEGSSGTDQLHVVLEPAQLPPQGTVAWLAPWLAAEGTASKDIRLDSESTPSGTYLVNPVAQGVVTTLRIVHR